MGVIFLTIPRAIYIKGEKIMSKHELFEKQWAEVIAKAWMDPKFKARLLQHPREALEEMGVKLPHGIHPKIMENTNDQVYLVLPKKPAEKLSEAELKKVAAGISWSDTHSR